MLENAGLDVWGLNSKMLWDMHELIKYRHGKHAW
jgi:hypothetical protein